MGILYTKEPLERYLADAASGTPTPGGGSVSALAGALATTMASMSINLTLGRPEFKEVEPLLKELSRGVEEKRKEMLHLMHQDMEAYQGVMRAYRLPKSQPEEKKQRSLAIQEALKGAMDVPLRLARCSLNLLEDVNRMADKVNPNLAGDVAVAAILAEAALKGAKVNVEVNLSSLKDDGLVNKTRAEISETSERAQSLLKEVIQKVKAHN
ncbi:MAG TPA: cyclodeaminase/cyclohydrolase family protein [Candidatus Hypogeohydataceae bacterium YC38]